MKTTSIELLREREAQLRSIFRVAPIGIGVVVDRVFIQVNRRLCEMMGYDEKELVGQSVRMLYLNDEEYEYVGHEKYKQIKEHGTGTVETRCRCKNDHIIDVLLSSTPMDLNDLSKGVTFTVLDITKRKRMEDALRESKRELAKAQKIAKIGSWRWEIGSDEIIWSDEVYRIAGVSRQTFRATYKAYMALIHPDDRDRFVQLTSTVLEEKKTYLAEYKIIRPSGEVISIIERGEVKLGDDGEPVRLIGTTQDVTDIKQAEENRTRLAAAIEQASEVVVITDAEGQIQYVNPAFEERTGYSREEAIGQSPSILQSGRHGRKFYKEMWEILLRGEVWSGHLINRKKDGTLFEEEATISPVKNESGVITNFVAVKRDVSREVSLEKQLRHAMRMEAIGTLAGGIAHDFNNILTAILGYSEIVREQLPAGEQVQQDLDQVINAANRAADLVSQILTFSRQEEKEFNPLYVQLIIKEILKMLRSSLPATIKLEGSIDTDSSPIMADPTQIHQVLMNLCTNARQAIGDDVGTLSVSLAEIEVAATGSLADCPQLGQGRYLDLMIRDTGSGMDEQTQLKIFDPFFTTKEKGKGTGLGLSVVHGIVRRHKGEITVTSKPGAGTTFHVYLPVIGEEVHVEQSSFEEISRGNERILIVDDEIVLVEMMRRMLEGLGYRITGVERSLEALDTFSRDPGQYDLVITDMIMPEMTGLVLSQKILAIRPEIPIILYTGFGEAITVEKAKRHGIHTYLMKPVNRDILARAIREALQNTGRDSSPALLEP